MSHTYSRTRGSRVQDAKVCGNSHTYLYLTNKDSASVVILAIKRAFIHQIETFFAVKSVRDADSNRRPEQLIRKQLEWGLSRSVAKLAFYSNQIDRQGKRP